MKRNWFLWLLLIAFLWTVISLRSELETAFATFLEGQHIWLVAAVIAQAIAFYARAQTYHSAFNIVDVASRPIRLMGLVIAGMFVNAIGPTGGSASMALFVRDLSREGQSSARTTVGTLLVLLINYIAFFFVLAVGYTVLFVRHQLNPYEITGAAILLMIMSVVFAILIMGLRWPGRLDSLLNRAQGLVRRIYGGFKRQSPLAEDWAERTTREFSEAANTLNMHRTGMVKTIGIALSANIFEIAGLFAAFMAFHQWIGLGPLVAGYSVAFVLSIVVPTPRGIGVVESAVPLIYSSLGVPLEAATVVVLSFRFVSIWIPILLGFLLMQSMHLRSSDDSGQESAAR